ncbi:hypothetical protein CPB84DRAFT_48790 [Gymnopilus junonius]|uniref:DUF952 domain protein n=1 Tax=Gymnopilus junonius TaxID=109634 RepID=A0A9P5TUY6_GYMJU|nr:hypothetical protein CPB84DRAFT_48790 [Gymnopilus junonius]
MATPTYIYKIVPASPALPDPIPDVLPVSELDRADGFIHLSTALQIPGTLQRFFIDHEQVYILRIAYKDVENDINWENPKGTAPGEVGENGIFPHLHNGLRLGNKEIESVTLWKNGPDWNVAINKAKEDNWFRY